MASVLEILEEAGFKRDPNATDGQYLVSVFGDVKKMFPGEEKAVFEIIAELKKGNTEYERWKRVLEQLSLRSQVLSELESQDDVVPATKTKARRAVGPEVSPSTRRAKKIGEKAVDFSDDDEVLDVKSAGQLADDNADDSDAASPTARDSVKDYMQELKRTPLLDAAQEVELAKRIEAGLAAEAVLCGEMVPIAVSATDDELQRIAIEGKAAKEQFIKANLRLVVSIAKRYQGRGLLLLDLIQEGNLGLMHAVEKWDYTKGFKFSTYGTRWIMQRLDRGIATKGQDITTPVGVYEASKRINAVIANAKDLDEPSPTDEEIIQKAHVTAGQLKAYHMLQRRPISLNGMIGADGDTELGEILDLSTEGPTADDVVIMNGRRQAIDRALATLSEREAHILSEKLGLVDDNPKTLDQVAEMYGLKRNQVRQAYAKTLSKLRHPSRAHMLRQYSDD